LKYQLLFLGKNKNKNKNLNWTCFSLCLIQHETLVQSIFR
jgi:hypothetical protein